MATILSIKTVSDVQGARLEMDRKVNNIITLTLEDGRSFILSPFKKVLHYFDANTIVTNAKPKIELENYYFLNTAPCNKNYFPRRKLKETTHLENSKNVYFSQVQMILKDMQTKTFSRIVRS